MILANTPSLGILIGLPAAVLVSLIAIGFLLWALSQRSTADTFYRSDYNFVAFCSGAVLIATLLISFFCFFPFSWQYHSWKPVTGKVEQVSSRLISAGSDKGTNQRFVFVINGTAYGVDDTRAALIETGDTVSIKCKREYEWGSSNNGWGCKWNSNLVP